MVHSQKTRAIMAEMVSKAIQDASFRKKFIANPKKILADAGASLDPKTAITVVESTPSVCYVVLPAKEYMGLFKDQIRKAKDRLDSLPAGLEVRIFQNSDKHLYIALPATLVGKDGKLTDEALEMVAGGKSDTVQTAKVATTAYEAAEVATSAVQIAEVAADAAAAGEAVVVGVVVFI